MTFFGAVFTLAAITVPPAVPAASLPQAAQILALHHAALAPHGASPPAVLESSGTLTGANLNGTFATWHDPDHDRVDQILGIRQERTLRIGERQFLQNSSGNVIELKGLLLRRARTQDFITSADLFGKPQYSTVVGAATLPDGRDVIQLQVSPPGGEPETMDIDAQTHLLDRLEYVDGDGMFTIDFSDYRPLDGFLFSFKQVQSDGDHPYDITQIVTEMLPKQKISPETFVPFVATHLKAAAPITIPITERAGALYADVSIFGRTFSFLIDSGAQGVVLDSRVAASLTLEPEGSFEARGATRSAGIGVAALDHLLIGGAALPVHVVSVLDLNASTAGRFPIDGILGFPLFGACQVTIDYAHKRMTIAPPGTQSPRGEAFDIDVDRELLELNATVNGVQGRFLVDTGNGNELLIFHNFLEAHTGMLAFNPTGSAGNYGIGGATRAYATDVDELDIGAYRFFHSYANVILSDEGAFADRFDAGNIGLGVLKNFVVTFDVPDRKLFLTPGVNFNDGRDRTVFR